VGLLAAVGLLAVSAETDVGRNIRAARQMMSRLKDFIGMFFFGFIRESFIGWQ
jgi:hypothetical protein